MLKRLAAAALLACAYVAVTATSAFGEGCPPGQTPSPAPGGGVICIVVTDPGAPAGPGDPVDPGTSSSESSGCHRDNGTPVECVAPWGVWDDAHQCWIHPVDVPRTDPVWEGHNEGSIWMCAEITDGVDPLVMFWVPRGGGPVALPDPGELAEQAVGLLRLEAADVRTAPLDPARTFVGVENWLWVPESQWATLTKTVTAGGTSVTVAAKPDRVSWELGTEAKTCYDSGREWKVGMTDDAVTTCGYEYEVTSHSAPDGAFRLSAAIGYQVDWVCTGACTSDSGTLGLVDAPVGFGRLRVLQRQTVVVQ